MDGQNAITLPDISRRLTAWETLLNRDDNYQIQNDGLAERVDSDSPTQYTIHLRQGVQFHDGKEMTAEDVIYSLQRVGDKSNALNAYVMTASMDIANIQQLDKYTVRLPLKTPDSALLEKLANVAFSIVPTGYKPFSGDPSTQIGTGPYKLKSFTPGQQSVHERNPNYWRGDGSPWFDQVTISNFADSTAQVNALLGGQIDAMTDVPQAQIASLESRGSRIVSSQNGFWLGLCMNIDVAPFDDERVRQAFRLIVDRQAMLDQVASGRGKIGNDLYSLNDPAYNADLPQRQRDISQAKALLKAAGHESLTVDLNTTNGAAGQVSIATVFAQQAKEAGVTVNVKNLPGSTFYGEDFLKYPFSVDFWTPFPYMLQVPLSSLRDGLYNETHWPPREGAGSNFADLYSQALAETNTEKRIEIEGQMQKAEYEQGGYIIPFFPDKIDGHAANVQGFSPSKLEYNLGNFGHGFRNIWFA
ncbi:ABC transporter substrate-binding protein [Arthrobacter sp. HMWF013]|uniref:ABC transporter substrate-binding protein n=1 Tax=Arthrobacter sp. HMWF013 TaxID=2056849 RepID=UPI0015E810F5|nr:ABC transporter substrate-binding protein [Arthrobacter sp. HMWF013]